MATSVLLSNVGSLLLTAAGLRNMCGWGAAEVCGKEVGEHTVRFWLQESFMVKAGTM